MRAIVTAVLLLGNAAAFVTCYEVCFETDTYTLYCKEGSHCCGWNKCCTPGLQIWVIVGLTVALLLLLSMMVLCYRSYDRRKQQLQRLQECPQATTATTLETGLTSTPLYAYRPQMAPNWQYGQPPPAYKSQGLHPVLVPQHRGPLSGGPVQEKSGLKKQTQG